MINKESIKEIKIAAQEASDALLNFIKKLDEADGSITIGIDLGKGPDVHIEEILNPYAGALNSRTEVRKNYVDNTETVVLYADGKIKQVLLVSSFDGKVLKDITEEYIAEHVHGIKKGA